MPIRRRHDSCGRDGVPCWRINASLVSLTTLAVARHWGGVESFVVRPAGGVVDAYASAGRTAASARAPVTPRRSLGRRRCGAPEGVRGLGLVLRASLGDEDEFDTVSLLSSVLCIIRSISFLSSKIMSTCQRQHEPRPPAFDSEQQPTRESNRRIVRKPARSVENSSTMSRKK